MGIPPIGGNEGSMREGITIGSERAPLATRQSIPTLPVVCEARPWSDHPRRYSKGRKTLAGVGGSEGYPVQIVKPIPKLKVLAWITPSSLPLRGSSFNRTQVSPRSWSAHPSPIIHPCLLPTGLPGTVKLEKGGGRSPRVFTCHEKGGRGKAQRLCQADPTSPCWRSFAFFSKLMFQRSP